MLNGFGFKACVFTKVNQPEHIILGLYMSIKFKRTNVCLLNVQVKIASIDYTETELIKFSKLVYLIPASIC